MPFKCSADVCIYVCIGVVCVSASTLVSERGVGVDLGVPLDRPFTKRNAFPVADVLFIVVFRFNDEVMIVKVVLHK